MRCATGATKTGSAPAPISKRRTRRIAPSAPDFWSAHRRRDFMPDDRIDAHPAFARGQVAVITGAASGIGLAAARRFARAGMRVCIADLPGERLEAAFADVTALASANGGAALAVGVDVGRIDDLQKLKAEVSARFGGGVAVLMNNAGISRKTTAWTEIENWRKLLEVNLW